MAVKPVGSGEAAAAATAPRGYEFGPYRLEASTRRLLRSGTPVPLTPRAFDTLLVLVERRDRVVEKAELMQLVWADSFVEEANLSQTIFVLRKTLGDAPDGRPYHRHGAAPRLPLRGACARRGRAATAPAVVRSARALATPAPWIATGLVIGGRGGIFGHVAGCGQEAARRRASNRWSSFRSAISRPTAKQIRWPRA